MIDLLKFGTAAYTAAKAIGRGAGTVSITEEKKESIMTILKTTRLKRG